MKGTRIFPNTMALLAAIPNAFTGTTTRAYNSSIVAQAVAGFLVLFEVIQVTQRSRP